MWRIIARINRKINSYNVMFFSYYIKKSASSPGLDSLIYYNKKQFFQGVLECAEFVF